MGDFDGYSKCLELNVWIFFPFFCHPGENTLTIIYTIVKMAN